ncbi:TlpA disulfide reductase family protein [Soonwooa sp.]|uniref:TlpA disulfide reductase family protein n=1 Tax=Soonwooa sp. TaxID=1938592 RepID=UPI00260193CD|nr:TlpA disulfide reductase family protein [Soonwooa sp.]
MKSKYYFTFLLVLIYHFACCQASSNFQVLGKTKGLNAKYIYFSYDGVGNKRKWDSIRVKNNEFRFSGCITESKNAFITILKKDRVSDLNDPKITERIFIDPNSTIKINIDNPLDFHTAKINGSKSNSQYYEYKKLKGNSDSIDVTKNYINQNFNSYVGLYLIKQNIDNFSYNELNNFYENLSADLKNSEYGKYLLEYKSKLENSIVGKNAINFSTLDVHGNNLSLSDFRGKYVLLDFWASWCKPCRENNPKLIQIFNKYKKEDLIIIGIALDAKTDEQWRKAIEKDQTEIFFHTNDINNTISDLYAIPYIPVQILIDKNGLILHRYDDVSEPIENIESDLKEIFKY